MNKTVTINISGIIFHIEEDAYEILSKYLSTIRSYFVNAQDKDEIMSDIEARIAELLKEKVSDYKQVVLMADVDHVMNIMGKPEDFASDESQQQSTSQEEAGNYYNNRRRRIFRDPDGKILGGVCSGFANYFDIEPLWIRIALVVLVFMSFGVLIPLYIILWIIIPEARTTAEKLEMRGEKIDINNISKTVKEEAEQFKQRMEKMGDDFRSNRPGDKLADFLRQFFTIVFKVLTKLIGLFFLIIGIGFMVAVIAVILNKATIDGANAQLYVDDFLGTNKFMVFMGIVLVIGVPAIMLLYKGFKMLFNIKFHNKWLNIGSGVLWTIGFIILLIAGINLGKEFESEGKTKTRFELSKSGTDTLYVSADLTGKILEQYDSYREVSHNGKIRIHGFRDNSYQLMDVNGEKHIYGSAQVTIVEAESDSFEINIIKIANGIDKRSALERAKNISYSINQQDSLVIIQPLFKIEKGEKLRAQEVIVQIKVPRGKVVKLDKSLYSFLHDVDNITNTWDGDMVDRRWKMTAAGLECVDCDGLDINDIEQNDAHIHISKEIKVNNKDADVKVDKEGIRIKSEEANINIDKNGIKIETKKEK